MPIEKSSSPPSTSPTAIEESNTSIKTAKRSSMISTANTKEANLRCRIPKSLRAFMMIVVDDIEIIPPRKIRLIIFNPKI